LERLPTKRQTKTETPVALVTRVLEGYASKGVFRGFSAQPASTVKASYRMVWHHDRPFDLTLDVSKKTLRFSNVLPGVTAGSQMYRELKAFLKALQSPALPEHRRVNPSKATIRASNRRGSVSVTMTVNKRDFEYATRKIVHVVHEIFLIFLVDGPYYDYLVEQLGFDPDRF